MATPVPGYNIAFKIGNKTLAGRTQDDLTIAAKTKESLTKDDGGSTQVSITGHDVTFRATGLIDVTSGSSSILDRDDIIVDVLKTGAQESSNSSDDATYTVDFRVTGAVTAS